MDLFDISYLILLGSFVLVLWSSRRLARSAASAGYWRGRIDEQVLTVYLSENRDDADLDEVRQVIAQQVERIGVQRPDPWKEWDGVDRISFSVPEEIIGVLGIDDVDHPLPSFLRPRRSWFRR